MPWIAVISFLFFLLLFKQYPEIDLTVSDLAFKEGSFVWSKSLVIKWLDKFIEYGSLAIWGCFLLYFGMKEKREVKFFTKANQTKYLALVGLLGSVAAIHIIKRYYLRCRPLHIEAFGGMASFTGPWEVNLGYLPTPNACLSFVSGHAALGFLICSLAFLYEKSSKKHKRFLLLGLLLGGSFGLMRILQGQHFLSDVIFSGYIVFFSAFLLNLLIKPLKK
jgi:lipid A 4'-phosphatase